LEEAGGAAVAVATFDDDARRTEVDDDDNADATALFCALAEGDRICAFGDRNPGERRPVARCGWW
jgi:hypothetical protein